MNYKLQNLPDVEKVKNIFFVGIKGVGVAPLAIIARQAGFNIAGSDLAEEFITDEALNSEEILVFENFEISDIQIFFEHFDKEECLVITTGAHKGFDNPQALWAKNNSVEVISQGQALGIFMNGSMFDRDFSGISVAGSHGKTTIASLLATSFTELGVDPSYTVGTGRLFPTGLPGHYGHGEYFIAEADEYSSEPIHDKIPKFLYQSPKFAIFNNIDFDHPDLFPDIKDVQNSFEQFALNVKSEGALFLNGDDKLLLTLRENINKDIRIVTYGEGNNNDYRIDKIVCEGFESRFTVYKKDQELGVFELNIPGKHNATNSLAVIALLYQIGFAPSEIRNAIRSFRGSKRRLELIGKTDKGAIVIDDYGHHPLEISTTLSAIKKAFKDKKVVCIFQSHTYSRTKALLTEFANSFKDADFLCLLPIFKSQRDSEQDIFPTEDFINAFRDKKGTIFREKSADMVKYITENHNSSDNVIITIGAGEVYKIGYELIPKKLR